MSATYQNTELSVEERVDLLLAEMTIEEKAAQLTAVWAYEVLDGLEFSEEKAKRHFRDGIGQITRIGGATNHGPVGTGRIANEIQQFLTHRTRLQIPAIVHEESCSGYMAKGATCFPQSIGIASTWDETIARRVGAVIREQMRAAGAHQGLAPLLDVTRDPRWGRVEETFGEDPYLVAQMGIGYVEGLQGDRLTDGVIATGKHFVGYGISEGGMNWAPAHIPERELHDVYLDPFEAVVRQAKLGSIMPGYHELDGIPCHHSGRLLVDVLRNTWGFEGIVVSDYFDVHGGVDVSCVVTNTSAIAGEEVVQLYVHDVEADVTRPLQELRGYARVFLRPGERMQVTFTLSAHQLGFYNRGLRYVVEPGVIDVSIGAASDDIRLRGHFTIDGEVTDVESEKIFTTTVNTSSLGEGAQ